VRALRTIGETTGFSTGSDDVSATVIDLEARLTALQAAESSYLDLIDRAANVAEVMSVYSALTEVRAQIESLEAQARTIADQVEMAALSVSFTREAQPIVEATEGFDPAAIAERALGDLAGIARGLIGTLIYGSVLLAPVATIGALVVAFRRIRRR